MYDQYIGYDKTKLELARETEGFLTVQTHRAADDCLMTLELLRCVADRERSPDYDKYCEVRSKATGKTVEEVSRPLGSSGKRKDPIWLEYAKMFQDGVSLAEMAEFKKVKIQTVEENLVEAFKNDHIASVDFLIQPEYEAGVRAFMQRPDWNGRFTPIKDGLSSDCSWTTIKAVVAKVRKERTAAQAQKKEPAHVDDIILNAKKGLLKRRQKLFKKAFFWIDLLAEPLGSAGACCEAARASVTMWHW